MLREGILNKRENGHFPIQGRNRPKQLGMWKGSVRVFFHENPDHETLSSSESAVSHGSGRRCPLPPTVRGFRGWGRSYVSGSFYPEEQYSFRKGRMLLRKINTPPQSGQKGP